MSSHPGARHSLATRVASRRRPGLRAGLLAAGAVASVLGAVTACSAVQGDPTPVAETSAIGGAPAQKPALTGLNLKVTQVPAGTVVTNDGYTVYRFAKDSAKPAKSTCNGACAQQWPPVLATDTPWLKGVPSDKVGTVVRADGTKQLTLGGWPLYRFAKDAKPGDTAGQNVGGTWAAVGPDGKPAKLAGAAAPKVAAPNAAPNAAAPKAAAPKAESPKPSTGSGAETAGSYGASDATGGGY